MGPVVTLFLAASYIPGFCIINYALSIPAALGQSFAMQCYQLSRLYYCFSKNQVHSDKGYANWLFISLASLLIIWFVSGVASWYSMYPERCYIQRDGTAVYEAVALFLPLFFNLIPIFLYFVLELTTVLAYWCKIRSFRRYQNEKDRALYDRIQSILHRVLILTFFYLFISITTVILFFIGAIAVFNGVITSSPISGWIASIRHISISCSMFLMQDHNTSEYIKYLHFIKQYKCVLCFGCCSSMVEEQYRMLVVNVDEREVNKEKSIQTANTRNISADVEYANKVTGMELSVVTQTVCDTAYVIPEQNPELSDI